MQGWWPASSDRIVPGLGRDAGRRPLRLCGTAVGSRREFQVFKLEGGLLREHSCRAGGRSAERLSYAPLKRFVCVFYVCFSLCFLPAILRYCAYRR